MLARRAALLAAVCLAACDATIAGGLSEQQANDVMVALDGQGVSATKEREEGGRGEPKFHVDVSPDDVPRALGVMRAADLPRTAEPGLAEVFGHGGLVPTATEERARYIAALGGDLALSIEAIDGVLDARVHVALPDAREAPLDAPSPRPRASVLIKYRRGRAPYDPQSIRALVAGAVQGMEAADVAVVGVPAPRARRPRASLVRIGPVAVTRASAPALKAILGGALVMDVVLALALVLVLARRRRA